MIVMATTLAKLSYFLYFVCFSYLYVFHTYMPTYFAQFYFIKHQLCNNTCELSAHIHMLNHAMGAYQLIIATRDTN